jgi:putative hydrolase of the HAD superfamily
MTLQRCIQAVTFDVGGTLIEPWPSVGHVYAEVAAWHGLRNLSPDALNRQFATAWSALKEFNHSRAEWAGLVQATFRGVAEAPRGPAFFADLYARFGEPGAWRVFDDVVPTLEALASLGIKLGVISNWDERLRPLLRRLKLHDYFETIVVSHEVGFPKPSPVIFQHAAEKLALPAEAILHVGDSLEMDAQGARAAGLAALELRRDAGGISADQVKTLLDLQTLLPALAHT